MNKSKSNVNQNNQVQAQEMKIDQQKVNEQTKRMREALLDVVVGGRGIGKTHLTKKIIDLIVKGNKYTRAKKVLIMDVNNEYSEYKTLKCDRTNILRFMFQKKIQARRIIPFDENSNSKSTNEIINDLIIVLDTFRNGALILDDINKYQTDSLKGDLIGKLCTLRHVGVDVIIQFQGIGKAGHPKIKMNMNRLRLHKTKDSIDRHETKFEDDYEIIKLGTLIVDERYSMWKKLKNNLVKKKPHVDTSNKTQDKEMQRINNKFKYFYVYVDFDEGNIKGNFSESEMREAIRKYIAQNEKDTVKKVLAEKDLVTGKVLYTYKEAYDKVSNELFDEYWGN